MIPILFTRSADLQRWHSTLPTNTSLALVPTMGALHAGHERLMTVALSMADIVIASIFVNPIQFNDPTDLAKYPRSLDIDIEICTRQGIDAIFAPSFDEVYPANSVKLISAGRLGSLYEGEYRPGHFDGVLTVVDRLFRLVSPHIAVFGEKDIQQLVLIRQMSVERHPDIKILSVPTVRDPDGLALSSRNVRLTETERVLAARLYESLCLIKTHYQSGIVDARRLELFGRDFLNQFSEVSLDYLVCVNSQYLDAIEFVTSSACVILAATIGNVRLIDNIFLQ